MPSFIDYYNYSFEELADLLEQREFLPSRRILDQHEFRTIFAEFETRGIPDLAYLLKRLRKNKSIRHYATELGVEEEYLVVLRRELQSLVPRAKPLKDLPHISIEHFDYLASLKSLGITNTYHLLHKGRTREQRQNLVELTGIPMEFLEITVSYADLFQCFGIKSVIAQLLIDLGIDSTRALSQEDPKELYERMRGCSTRYAYISTEPKPKEIRASIIEAGRVVQRLLVE